MIIECPSCRTRFRLDENRIKGRGARVRCRRCGDSIMVLKPKEPEDIGGTLDLRSAVRESLGERPISSQPPPPPSGAEGAIPASPPAEPGTAPAAEPSGVRPQEVSPPQPDEIDLAFDRILESSREEIAEKPAEPAAPPEEDIEKAIPLESAPSDFLLSDTDTLSQLKKEFHEETPAELGKTLDISGSLRPEAEVPPVPAEDLRTPSLPAVPPVVPVEEEEPAAPSPQDFESQLRDLSAAEPEPAQPPPPAQEPAPAIEPASPHPPERRDAPAPRFRPSLAVLVLLFLVLAGGGAYFGFTKSGQETLRSLFPGMEQFLMRGGKSGPQFDVRNLIGYYEPNADEGSLFVIKGQVINVGRTRKSAIRIHASLLDDKDRAVKETICYAGNVLPGETLRAARRAEIEKLLTNRFGERLTNMDVQPGKSVPFMVVFFDAPDEISAYRLEALEGD